MSEENHLASAYSFSIASEDAFAVLRLGGKKLKVQVTDFSWAGFTITASTKLGKKFKVGTSGTLNHQGSQHQVIVVRTSRSGSGDLLVSLSRLESRANLRQSSYGTSKSQPRTVTQTDPFFMPAVGVCLILLVLALPGWGDSWGTSHYFSDGLSSVGRTLYQSFYSFRGR